jgi:lipopolysaccharide transport system ATP-binding protein
VSADVTIRVERLSKRYRITATDGAAPAGALRGLARRALSPFAYLRESLRAPAEHEVLWALRDVSFEVRRGEVLGVVGQNGSGKSTLLKILSRITAPSEGVAEIRGRVASLLEVGTGFHPELTGRENVYMNGAVLGMTRSEIAAKFDEIVAFAGGAVEQMLDTPVKRYSSGMQVRLGFAVAAHLEPEVLFIDEVLSVGDAAFTEKCIGKVDAIRRSGRTILLVSHGLATVERLCTRAVWLDRGQLRAEGSAREVVDQYLASSRVSRATQLTDTARCGGNGRLRFTSMELQDASGACLEGVSIGAQVRVVLRYAADGPLRHVHANVVVRDQARRELVRFWTPHQDAAFEQLPPRGEIVCTIPRLPLAPGKYLLDIDSSVERELADWIVNAGQLTVFDGDFFGRGGQRDVCGLFLCDHGWQARSTAEGADGGALGDLAVVSG